VKLQVASQLAIYSILELVAEPNRQLTVADIAAKYAVSTNHLAKVMNVLGRSGFVRSVRGVGGGFQFCGNARRTTLLEIIELFEPRASLELQASDLGGRTPEAAALGTVLREIDDTIRATLGCITIATLRELALRERSRSRAA
jgi:Rrf2 family nitric oxide-sensitive transcriptional repressor